MAKRKTRNKSGLKFRSGSEVKCADLLDKRKISSDRSKHLRIKKTYPELDIRFMFDNPNAKLYKGSKSTNADWCIKYGYKFCKLSDGLPKEWFKK